MLTDYSFGRSTVSITWMTPLVPTMSVFTTFAPPTVTAPSSTTTSTDSPLTVGIWPCCAMFWSARVFHPEIRRNFNCGRTCRQCRDPGNTVSKQQAFRGIGKRTRHRDRDTRRSASRIGSCAGRVHCQTPGLKCYVSRCLAACGVNCASRYTKPLACRRLEHRVSG